MTRSIITRAVPLSTVATQTITMAFLQPTGRDFDPPQHSTPMLQNIFQFEFFRTREEYGVVFLRLLIGVFIIHGVSDNVFSWEHMVQFEKFLAARGVPYPLFSAHLSAYAQFICGLSILLGAFIRPASIVFIINFIAAIVIAHLGHSFQQKFPALMMIAAGLFFLFHGAGPLSVDAWLQKRKVPHA